MCGVMWCVVRDVVVVVLIVGFDAVLRPVSIADVKEGAICLITGALVGTLAWVIVEDVLVLNADVC